MVIPLPSALTDFSKLATSAIQALDAIQKAVQNPQAVVQDNISKAATAATTLIPGDLFADAPGFVDENNQGFIGDITSPKDLVVGLQQESAAALFGTDATVGISVDGYLDANVRLQDVLPSQQIYALSQNLSISSIYADPLQAYAHIASGAKDIENFCHEASGLIAKLLTDLSQLLTIQLDIDYSQFASMGPEFFLNAVSKIQAVIAKHGILCAQLQIRGKFDPTATADLCTLIDDFAGFMTFANTKILQFDRLRQDILSAITRIRQIGRDFLARIGSVSSFVPNYIASTASGKIFQSLQKKVCSQAGVNLGKILSDAKAFSSANADDRSKVTGAFAMAGQTQSIKAFICALQPSTDVDDPLGPYATLNAGYNSLSASLTANDPTSLFQSLESQADSFSATMNAGVTNDNKAELSSATTSLLSILTSLAAQFAAILAESIAFKLLFGTQTQADPNRIVGPLDLYDRIGADNSRSASIANSGDSTAIQIGECTTLGQLSESIKATIDVLADGNEKDQLTLLYSDVVARHRAIILSMDFTRREDIRVFFAPSSEEANRELVNKVVKTYSGIPKSEFDPVFTT